MVLESLIRPSKMEKHPCEMLFIGFFYSTLGLFLAYYIFEGCESLTSVFITTIPLVLVMVNTIKYEEKKSLNIRKERFLMKEHGKALSMFFFLFMGMVISYSFWFTVLPAEASTSLFSFQIGVIKVIQQESGVIGNYIAQIKDLRIILSNNLTVLFFCLLFSFLYGAGAIFILAMNASVIGVAVGSGVRDYIASRAFETHSAFLYNYFNSSISITFCYMLHGVFEVSAYIIAALAGGIISVAVVNHDYRSKDFWNIITDSSDLFILSFVLVVLGAFIEVFITPVVC